MPDDSTRKLLKVFGVSVTDCEEALGALTAALHDPAATPAHVAAAIDQPQDGDGSWPDDSAGGPRACGRGHPVVECGCGA